MFSAKPINLPLTSPYNPPSILHSFLPGIFLLCGLEQPSCSGTHHPGYGLFFTSPVLYLPPSFCFGFILTSLYTCLLLSHQNKKPLLNSHFPSSVFVIVDHIFLLFMTLLSCWPAYLWESSFANSSSSPYPSNTGIPSASVLELCSSTTLLSQGNQTHLPLGFSYYQMLMTQISTFHLVLTLELESYIFRSLM